MTRKHLVFTAFFYLTLLFILVLASREAFAQATVADTATSKFNALFLIGECVVRRSNNDGTTRLDDHCVVFENTAVFFAEALRGFGFTVVILGRDVPLAEKLSAIAEVAKNTPDDGQFVLSVQAHGEGSLWTHVHRMQFIDGYLRAATLAAIIDRYSKANTEVAIILSSCYSGMAVMSCRAINRLLITSAPKDDISYFERDGHLNERLRVRCQEEPYDKGKDAKECAMDLLSKELVWALDESGGDLAAAFHIAKPRQVRCYPNNTYVNNPQMFTTNLEQFLLGYNMTASTPFRVVDRDNSNTEVEFKGPYIRRGDPNNDGVIDHQDFNRLLEIHWQFADVSERELFALDISEDGIVDLQDAHRLIEAYGHSPPIERILDGATLPRLDRQFFRRFTSAAHGLKTTIVDIEKFFKESFLRSSDPKYTRALKRRVAKVEKALASALEGEYISESDYNMLSDLLQQLKQRPTFIAVLTAPSF